MLSAIVKFCDEPNPIEYDLSYVHYGIPQMSLWYDISCKTNDDFVFANKIGEWIAHAHPGDTYSDNILAINIQIVKEYN